MNSAGGSWIRAMRGPVMMVLLGVLLTADRFGSYSFSRTWPVLIIALGLLKLLEIFFNRPAEPPAAPGGRL